MKTTTSALISWFPFFVGCLSVVVFPGPSMTVPIKPCAMAGSATVKDVKEWIWHKSLELSRVVGETQNDFAQIRLGDVHYDEYVHQIPGLPRYGWHLDTIPEPSLLKKLVDELFAFDDFFTEIKSYEVHNGNNFVTKFQNIITNINIFIGYFQQLEMCEGYNVTLRLTTLQPTPSPTLTPKQHDEWELGVQKNFLHWLFPVQVEFHRQSSSA
ncbi:uncharacterized protein [Montipora capricornis]|uniref:uncharacterized protein n=1 Tax=Montipora capricornis TaxID=246305 RepID=UPI0035F12DC6